MTGEPSSVTPDVPSRPTLRRRIAARGRGTTWPHALTDLPTRILLGRAALAFLFVVVPVFNPSVFEAGDERLYVGTVVVLGAAALMLPSLRSTQFRWIAVGLLLGAAYVLEAGLLRGDRTLGVVGNTYRPLHAVLVFSACAVFLLAAKRELWIRLFLIGGAVGCGLAVLNTLVPAFDPFAVSRPDIPFESRLLTSRRQEGAFVYPGNFGPYAAYVAIVALVVLEQKRLRLLSLNLYTIAFVLGILGIIVSASRGALLGLLFALAVVMARSPRFRLPLLVGCAVGVALVAVTTWIAGTFSEVVESRILGADFSLSLRLEHWRFAWNAFVDNPLFGAGVVPNTIDSTFFYYLGVGGLVGLVIVAAMYLVTLLRPLRNGDWVSLPLVAAVFGVGIFQEALGTPLTTWAIGAGVFLLSTTKGVYGSSDAVETPAHETEGVGG